MDTAAAEPLAPLASSAAVRRLVLGLLLVLLDLRVAGFDVLVDAAGWFVVVGALGELRRVVPALAPLRVLAVLGAALSFADLVHPRVTTVDDAFGDGSMTTTATTAVDPVGVLGAVATAYSALTTVFLVLLCLALASAAAQQGQRRTAGRLRAVAWTTAVVQGAGVVFGVAAQLSASGAPVGQLPAGAGVALLGLVLAVGGFLTTVWVLVALWGLRVWPLLQAPSDTAVRR